MLQKLVKTRSLRHKELKYLVNLSFSFLKPGKTTTSWKPCTSEKLHLRMFRQIAKCHERQINKGCCTETGSHHKKSWVRNFLFSKFIEIWFIDLKIRFPAAVCLFSNRLHMTIKQGLELKGTQGVVWCGVVWCGGVGWGGVCSWCSYHTVMSSVINMHV